MSTAARLPLPRARHGCGRSEEEPAQTGTNCLVDTYGRVHDDLRISVTDRCNFRCVYCLDEEAEFLPRGELLTYDEIVRIASVARRMGVRTVRLTGGEPLQRRGIVELVERLAALGFSDLAMTTNGVGFARLAGALGRAGLRRVNISCDSLRPERFACIRRRGQMGPVLEAMDAAEAAGLEPVKVNVVLMAGVNDDEIEDFAAFARTTKRIVRFIEFMPLDAQSLWDRSRVLLADDMVALLSREICPLEDIPDPDPRAPATEYRFSDGIGRVGFIASVSHPFCLNCNRLRLTSDGMLRYCLFAIEEADVKTLLRNGASDAEIEKVIRGNVHEKWLGHEINSAKFVPPPRPMYSIGG